MSAILSPASKSTQPSASSQSAFDLLFSLSEAHREWILNAGIEIELPAGTVLFEEGSRIHDFYILIEGVMSVYHPEQEDKPISTIGPGQIIGDMSFIEQLPASASVKAVERCMLLQVPFEKVMAQGDADVSFKSELSHALLYTLSCRLRLITGKLSSLQNGPAFRSTAYHERLVSALDAFKESIFKTQECETKRQEEAFRKHADLTAAALADLFKACHEYLSEDAPGTPQEKDSLGYKIQQEMAPYLLMSNTLKRAYTKPRGYAGDYLTIAQAYDDVPMGTGRTGELLDNLVLHCPPIQAVKNRRKLLAEEIRNTLEAADGKPVNITVFACGPARELFEVYAELDHPAQLNTTLIDIDLQALAYVAERKDAFRTPLPMQLYQENLIYLALGRRQLTIPPQDLIYSIGLIDYFNDQLVVKLSDYAHKLLKPGGRLIFGNFHTDNPSKAFMDHVIDWKLIHRNEADMDRLFMESSFGKPSEQIRFEEEGINMFAICRK